MTRTSNQDTGVGLGFEAVRWAAADRHGQGVALEARLRATPLPKLNCSELEMVRTTDLMEGVA